MPWYHHGTYLYKLFLSLGKKKNGGLFGMPYLQNKKNGGKTKKIGKFLIFDKEQHTTK